MFETEPNYVFMAQWAKMQEIVRKQFDLKERLFIPINTWEFLKKEHSMIINIINITYSLNSI